jgi:hypothetical protein
MQRELICGCCNIKLELTPTTFEYMGHVFHHDLPRCPQCAQVYIDEALAQGRMRDVEMELEDK